MKTMESEDQKQVKVIEEYGKQPAKSNKFSKYILPPDKYKETFQNLINERMEQIEELHQSFGFKNLIYHFKSENVGIHYFIYTKPFYNMLNSHILKLDDVEKNQMKFKSKTSNIKIGGNKSSLLK